jgi:hypothetical protein
VNLKEEKVVTTSVTTVVLYGGIVKQRVEHNLQGFNADRNCTYHFHSFFGRGLVLPFRDGADQGRREQWVAADDPYSYNQRLLLKGKVDGGVSFNMTVSRGTMNRIRAFAKERPLVCLPTHDPESEQGLIGNSVCPRRKDRRNAVGHSSASRLSNLTKLHCCFASITRQNRPTSSMNAMLTESQLFFGGPAIPAFVDLTVSQT